MAIQSLPPIPLNLEELLLSNQGLSSLPEDILRLSQLHTLMISKCPIKEIPPSIASLHNLRYLSIKDTPVEKGWNAIASLPNLEKLRCGYSNPDRITKLPAGFSKLKYLIPFGKVFLSEENFSQLRLEGLDLTNTHSDYVPHLIQIFEHIEVLTTPSYDMIQNAMRHDTL